MKRMLKCFNSEIKKLRSYMIVDLGTQAIEIKRIVGSVDKCDVFDPRFRNKKNTSWGERTRMSRVQRVTSGYGVIDPIDVYLFNHEYYVLDGHRRIASAKDQGIEYFDAHVVEYIDSDDLEAVKGTTLKRRFETETKLKHIMLHNTSGYGTLLREATAFDDEKNPTGRPRKWYSQVFLPFIDC